MTFEWTAEEADVRARAQELAASHVTPQAAAIDGSGAIPDGLMAAVGVLTSDTGTPALVGVVEVLATASAAVAISAASPADGVRADFSGLRGARLPTPSARAQLVLAATALGVGKAAVDLAVLGLKQAQGAALAEGAVEAPQWVVADAATELEAARLLTYKAAHSEKSADIAVARLMASAAAQRAVDAALRLAGLAGFKPGTALDRLARDVRTVSLLMGGEEEQRSDAAAGLLSGR